MGGVDPTGLYVESFWDVAAIGMDAASLSHSIKRGDVGGMIIDTGLLTIDVVYLVLPGVPAVGPAVKVGVEAITIVGRGTGVGRTVGGVGARITYVMSQSGGASTSGPTGAGAQS